MSEASKAIKFETIYNEHFKEVFRFLVLRLPSLQDAEDVATNVFEALWQNIDIIDTNASYRMWLYSTARHKLADYLRKYYKLEMQSKSYDDDFAYNNDINVENESLKVKNKYIHLLNKLVEKLNEKDQLFVKLKYKDNLSYTKIAKKMNITEGNAKVMNNRIVKKIKTLWETS
jgi:RNA polymerase sigma-70 factor (ECF subfamily)